MEIWFIANKLSLNADKTCYTAFVPKCKQQSNISLDLYINNQKITKVTSCKYLGVLIDESLTWEAHIDHIYKKLLKFTSIFYKLRNILPKVCLKNLYFSFIHPHILYGVEIYGNSCKTYVDKLCKLNNKLLRILLNKPLSTPVIDLYRSLNILPIPLLHEFQVLIFVYKCFYCANELPGIFRNYFIRNNSIHNHNTRQKSDLHFSTTRSAFGKRNINYRGSKFWNDLPCPLKQSSSLYLFKRNLKNYLLIRDSSTVC